MLRPAMEFCTKSIMNIGISFLWILLFIRTFVHADQTVYLSRPAHQYVSVFGNGLLEPFFSPNAIVANVGEKISFVAQFDNQLAYAVSEYI